MHTNISFPSIHGLWGVERDGLGVDGLLGGSNFIILNAGQSILIDERYTGRRKFISILNSNTFKIFITNVSKPYKMVFWFSRTTIWSRPRFDTTTAP